MNQVRIAVRDGRRGVHSVVGRDLAERIADSLSAEPETIEELERCSRRYVDPDEWCGFRGFLDGIDERPGDGGLVIIDLTARLTVMEWNDRPEVYDDETVGDETDDFRFKRFYRLPDDWLLAPESRGWRDLAEQRRRARDARPPLDARPVLYGRPLLEFVAAQAFTVFPDLPAGQQCESELDGPVVEGIRDVHARWLSTSRDDLRGKSPRDVLLDKRRFIDGDMQDRANQWSETGECPPTLDRDTHAWRYAGFGTHEVVMYYDLVRELLWSCREQIETLRTSGGLAQLSPGDFLTTEVPRLEQVRDNWLDAPDPEFSGRTPRSIIENERDRRPEAESGHDAMIDHDCPLCQMMADMPGPVFWHLDGSHMDWDFAFSFHRTREEYDAEQREYEEFSRRWDEKEAERKRLQLEDPSAAADDSVWKSSYVADDGPNDPVGMRLFGIGSRLAELTVELRQTEEVRPLIDQLNRDFGNLREVVSTPDGSSGAALIEPVLERFCETLFGVAEARHDLEDRCEDLQRSLRRFLEPPDDSPGEFPDYGDDVPS
ncbi:MAG: hypothetical protein DWQ29_08325 [Planctomycetota bacterium]|nr:MAG: hypothetical protein DWQ29_08325 [Planctomycetota bacterium]